MPTSPRPRAELACQLAALGLVLFLFAANVYRATTQSVTCDEAYMHRLFVEGPVDDLLRRYDACNHVLYTLAARFTTRWFGLSELSLRLPSLLGGLAYLLACFQLSRYLFGRRGLMLLSTAALTLNPFILDYLSVARGYGLALALFAWGLYLLVRHLSEDYDPPDRLLPWAGLLFGLSVAANLVFAVPFAVAGGIFTLMLGWRRLWWTVDRFWGPAVVPAFVLLALPMLNARGEHFYYGTSRLADTALSMVAASLFHPLDEFATLTHFEHGVRNLLSGRVVPALLLAILGVAVWRRRDRVLVLVAGSIAGSLAVLIGAHAALGVLYPLGRTGLYFALLFTLGCALALRALRPAVPASAAGPLLRRLGFVPGPRLALQIPLALCLTLAAARFATTFTTSYYNEWRYDAATGRIVADLARISKGRPLRVAASVMMHQSVRFYRRRLRADWLPAELGRPDEPGYDYYILISKELTVLKHPLRTVREYPLAPAVLAVPR